MDINFSKKGRLSDISSALKFQMFVLLCIFIHTSIAIFSFVYDITPLLIFNIGSVIIYISCIFILKTSQTLVFYIGFIEIILHSFVCVILVGHGFGFSMYFISLVPMAYHLLHATNDSHYLKKATFLAALSFLMYATCYILSYLHDPVYSSEALNKTKPVIYIINMLITFLALVVFSILFLAETESAYNKLFNKNKELGVLANRDPLTGLYNRRTMTEQVVNMYDESKETGNTFSLIICDIDDFKKVNDTYGHDCGDEVLKKIAEVLTTLTREQDFLCRWGGEEFLILLKSLDCDMAKTIAERIRQKIAETDITYKTRTLNITMTFGVACSQDTDDYESLFKLADNHLYQGKKTGKNKVV